MANNSVTLRITNSQVLSERVDLLFNAGSTILSLKQRIVNDYGANLGITHPGEIKLFVPKFTKILGFEIGSDNETLEKWVSQDPRDINTIYFITKPQEDALNAQASAATAAATAAATHAQAIAAMPLGPRDESEFLLLGNSTMGATPILGVARNSGAFGVVSDVDIHCGFIGIPKPDDGSIDIYVIWTTGNFNPAQFMYRYAKFYLDHFNRPFIATVDTPDRGRIGMDKSGSYHRDKLIFQGPAKIDDATIAWIEQQLLGGSALSDYVMLDYKSNNGACVGTQYQCGPTSFRAKMTSSADTSSSFMFNNTLSEHCTPGVCDTTGCPPNYQECKSVGNEMIIQMYASAPELVQRKLRRYEIAWLKNTPPELYSGLNKFTKVTVTKAELDSVRMPAVIQIPEGQSLEEFVQTPDMLRRQIGGIIYKKTRKHKSKKHNTKKQKPKKQKTTQNKKR